MKFTDDEVIIIKIGGSVITNKNIPYSLRPKSITTITRQIYEIYSQIHKKMIIIHGGGSFGHPVAHQYEIQNGIEPSIPHQILGLTQTHQKMEELNQVLSQEFQKWRLPTLSFPPSSMFIRENSNLTLQGQTQIKIALNFEIMPILYGDILFHSDNNFSILSGDEIVTALVNQLQKYHVKLIVFTLEEDGIYQKIPEIPSEKSLVEQITPSELKQLDLFHFDPKIDVTGGMRGKLKWIGELAKKNIDIHLVNGVKPHNLMDIFQGIQNPHTHISTRK